MEHTVERIVAVARGGTAFAVWLISDNNPGGALLGNMEFGTINDDGQYVQETDEIIEAARKEFGISDDVPGRVRY